MPKMLNVTGLNNRRSTLLRGSAFFMTRVFGFLVTVAKVTRTPHSFNRFG
jgi:hypothetical protein